MKNKLNKELFLQISIVLACLVILSFRFSTLPTHAQISCNNEPPPLDTLNPKKRAWLQGTTVSVEVFQTPNSLDFDKIKNGIRFWNSGSASNCSNVTFNEATQANRPYDENEPVPNDMIWVYRPEQGSQLYPEFRNTGTSSQSLRAARMALHPDTTHADTGLNALDRLAAHETGHSLGLGNENIPSSPGRSVMGQAYPTPTICDTDAVRRVYCPTPTPTATPTPTPNPTPTPGGCNGVLDWVQYPTTGCASGFVNSGGTCTRSTQFINRCDRFGGYNEFACGCNGGCENLEDGCSPIVIDIIGNGFALTNAVNGVNFDVDGDGLPERRAWTEINSDDSWLTLDRNGNGMIDGGRELFGSSAAQPPPPDGIELNGFNALAMYDEQGFGGNGDGQIDNQDTIFPSLRLWNDSNHNGLSEANELKTLEQRGLRKLDLDYKTSRRVDEHGNRFKYRAKVRDAQGAQLGRWAWDVFLVVEQP